MSDSQAEAQRILDALLELARVASVMVDGEQAKRIITDRAHYYLANPDTTYRFLSSDYYDVDAETFLRMKKMLLRLSMLVDFPCDASLWVRVKGRHGLFRQAGPARASGVVAKARSKVEAGGACLEDHVTVAVQNGNMKRYWEWAEQMRPLEPEMAECMEAGKATVAPPDKARGLVTVLAPVRDSLGEVVGFVELTAKDPTSTQSGPDWS